MTNFLNTNDEALDSSYMNRNDFCSKIEHNLSELIKKQGYLSKEEIFTCFERISTYVDSCKHNTCIQDYVVACRNRHTQNYIDYSTYRQEMYSVEPLSERQEICSQNAINCLFRQDFEQALYETLDVLCDFNKKTELNYNEYVVLQNILLTCRHLKSA